MTYDKQTLIAILASFTFVIAAVGCDGDDEETDAGMVIDDDAGMTDDDDAGMTDDDAGMTDDDAGMADAGMADAGPTDPTPRGMANPPIPGANTQIDRVGRAGITTALIDTFMDPEADRNAKKDAYNANDDPSTWSEYTDEILFSLAVLDSVDVDTTDEDGACGDQLAADQADDRYAFLASVLANDRLWIDSTATSCGQYLGIEANALGVTNSECGGRTPSMDVIETTYSALTIGAITGVDDTIASDPDGTPPATFPYLLAPTP